MCECGHLESESGSESRHLESESRRIRIHLYPNPPIFSWIRIWIRLFEFWIRIRIQLKKPSIRIQIRIRIGIRTSLILARAKMALQWATLNQLNTDVWLSPWSHISTGGALSGEPFGAAKVGSTGKKRSDMSEWFPRLYQTAPLVLSVFGSVDCKINYHDFYPIDIPGMM